ncbi:inorganic phosphate transporter [Tamlana sp. 2_MG-2023]|uniref:inorganic phosphate transporter n=1 Tax=unclassified Tamlana TaxID=2614803 RepID=UPI0026E13F16|nr:MULTISPECIES: inorganic phosphate transporter [unclassified Tamlana]MDO6758889.1 inorganic phosphate transporter [Tamlana sp. 2_MG-2023]MDO6789588.1 inorganic phosphate transporter [Tamlana sp. 1_MG-2023]
MENLYLFIVIILFVLAITDLIIGVSNDAVNFLTSALGSKAGSFKMIMIIATLGIMFGSVFSGGMMEIARSGVFNPSYFSMEEVMYLFAAVMITDIILLDFFNTVAMPTSTTVSIVFNLLGAAIGISFFSVLNKDGSLASWGDYINAAGALTIIIGIFLSVAIAFVVGWFVQYVTRVIVSFDYGKTMRSFASVFGSISVALISNFIIIKGLTGIPGVNQNVVETIQEHSGLVSILAFILSFLVFRIILRVSKGFNIYRFIVLLGTFALAMAFASNDLVNFIGVPIAGYDVYLNWLNSGVPANEYQMTSLSEPVKSNPLFLVGAGIIMSLTLWFSKKAKSVVKTAVDLGRQEEGQERFEGNELSRSIVSRISKMANTAAKIIPDHTWQKINKRFVDNTPSPHYELASDRPAFDMVRAAVNLIVAAGLILVATSFKLPLSTTFVSFMVLMGTSLADKAWSQGSSVYRVSGVLSVVGGWFLTAVMALTASIITASLLINFKLWALIPLLIITIILLFKSLIFYRNNRLKAEINLEMADVWFKSDFFKIEHEIRNKLSFIMKRIDKSYHEMIDALINSDLKKIKRQAMLLEDIKATNENYKFKLTQQIKSVPKEFREGGKALLYIHELQESMLENFESISTSVKKHIQNLHPKLEAEQTILLTSSKEQIRLYLNQIIICLEHDRITEADYIQFKTVKNDIVKNLDMAISNQISWATDKKLSGKNSELILTILFENKNLIQELSKVVKLFYKLKSGDYNNLIGKVLSET